MLLSCYLCGAEGGVLWLLGMGVIILLVLIVYNVYERGLASRMDEDRP